ncbi:origin recognition complex subunit 5 C-terminus-domain-containing protein [Mortierella sp. GBAus27b]|nr:origin recognition complex subunit 5 C-terminus-domain-containing protein [Mortierella sp. GBAus27b]
MNAVGLAGLFLAHSALVPSPSLFLLGPFSPASLRLSMGPGPVVVYSGWALERMQKLESLPSKAQKQSSHDLPAHHSLFIFPLSLIEQGLTASGREQQGSRGGSMMNKLPLQEQLHATFPGRARQIEQILGYMGEPCTPTPSAIFINGNSSLGKTAVIKTILTTVLGSQSPSRYAFLDCVECHTPRLIFEHAIYQLRNAPQQLSVIRPVGRDVQWSTQDDDTVKGTSPMVKERTKSQTRPNKEASRGSGKRKRQVVDQDLVWDKCESVNEFVEWCRKICDDDSKQSVDGHGAIGIQDPQRFQQETRYIVLDRAERLRDSAPDLIPVLMRLQELTRRNICVILISTIVWEKFRSKTGGYEPVAVNFPQYSKGETISILERDLPEGEDKDLYMRFIDLVYDVFQRNCKDLNEIRHLVALLFPLYIKPVKEGKIQKHEGLKLHRHIQTYFVEAMDKLYLREISSTEWSERTLLSASEDSSAVRTTATSVSSNSERALMNAVDVQSMFDLPYFTKFILIASFLASYNPPRLDMRYFAKVSNQGGKMTKRAKIAAAKKHGHDQLGGKLRQQLLGPKVFPIERMLAIFYSILDDEVEENVNVHTQVASLVSLRLLQRVTPMDKLDSIKCKCNVSYDTIKALAKSTKFDIDKYLYDFM